MWLTMDDTLESPNVEDALRISLNRVKFCKCQLEQNDEFNYELEFFDGYGHTWFFREYPRTATVREIYTDLYNYDPWEEFVFIIQSDITDKPDNKTLAKVTYDIDRAIEKTLCNISLIFNCHVSVDRIKEQKIIRSA